MRYIDIEDEEECDFEDEAEDDMEDDCNICHGSSEEAGRGYSGCGRVIEPDECVACTDEAYCYECLPEWGDRNSCDDHKKEYLANEGLAKNRKTYIDSGITYGGECEAAPDGDCESCGESGDFMYSTCPLCFKEYFI